MTEEQTFTRDEKNAAKALTTLWESGSFTGKPWLLVVFGENGTKSDGAGITYGKSQTTENSGGLWKLLFESYAGMNGAYVDRFSPYRNALYRKGVSGEKWALTNNQAFRNLLIEAGRQDPIMARAQDKHFDDNYFLPALQLCEKFQLSLPLSLAFIYDFCIHSGPGDRFNDGKTEQHLDRWDDDYEAPDTDDQDESEKHWVMHMCQKRDDFLAGIPHAVTTRYRTGSMLKMMREGGSKAWNLEVPLEVVFLRRAYVNAPDRRLTLTQEHLDQFSS